MFRLKNVSLGQYDVNSGINNFKKCLFLKHVK